MIIKNMFEKPIDRNINGVIKVGQKDEEIIYQELEEYVVTKQLLKHFREFFNNYASSINHVNPEIGVWISGFFGSGKSHFLKILSYLLDSNLTVNDRTPISFFEEKIDDATIIADMKKSAGVSTDVRLFNIDSKSSSRKDNDSIVKVFQKEFNALRGYCDNDNFFIADMERKLDEENKLNEFREEFENITGTTWIDGRDDFDFITEDVKEALVNINFMDEKQADHWIENAEGNYHVTIEKLSKQINEYCEKKGGNHHIVFLIDEIGQYIGDNTQLMLTLQTLVEDLGTNCNGKVWVMVTSQQDIGEIVKKVKDQDFSKIQGRFKTRINLTSSNVDEVIRRRILEKTSSTQEYLKSSYSNDEYKIKNLLTFDNKAELKTYKDSSEYSEVYPFVPYQFNLLQSVLTSVRLHSSTGKHLAEGERSMLGLFQEAAKTYKNNEYGTLIPFYTFYDPLEKWIDSDKSRVIDHAIENEELNEFDIKVLKTLLMIKHLDEIEGNITNITTLTLDNINTDRTKLAKQIEKSLQKLENQTLIGKNGDKYTFLTNDEQDANRAIKHEQVDDSEITNKLYEKIYDVLLRDIKKYRYDKQHDFEFNRSVDNYTKGHGNKDMGLRIITPQYEFNTTLEENDQTRHNALRELSQDKHEAIVYIKNDNIIEEIRSNLQISKYLKKNLTELSSSIRENKNAERQDRENRIDIQLEEAIKTATIYIEGHQVDIEEKHSKERINEALTQLCKQVYKHLDYMNGIKPEISDIKNLLEEKIIPEKEFKDHTYNIVLKKIEEYLQLQKPKPVYLKELIQLLSKKPYGYNDLEIQWLIIQLFTQNRVNIIYSNTNFNEYSNDKKITIIKQSKNYEKIIIEHRKQTSQLELKQLKDILLEITEINVPEEEIIKTLKNELYKIYEQINSIKVKYEENKRYPNKETVLEAYELYKKIPFDDKEELFVKYVLENQDELLDYNEDLGSTFEFFRGNQWELFDKGIKTTKIFEENSLNIENPELEEINNKILEILNNPRPYHEIPQLSQLCEEFNNIYEEELNKIRKPIIENLNKYEESLLKQLNTEELKQKFQDKIIKEYEKLKHKKETSKNISIITDENQIRNLHKKYSEKIEEYIEQQKKKENKTETDTTTPTTPTEPETIKIKAKTIHLNTLQIDKENEIDNEIELDEFINKLKNELKRELDINKKINIQL